MSGLETLEAEASQFKDDFQRILDEVHKVIVGQDRVVECTVTALLAGGNVLRALRQAEAVSKSMKNEPAALSPVDEAPAQ